MPHSSAQDDAALKRDILRAIDAGANRDQRDRLEREVSSVCDRATPMPDDDLIRAKERYRSALYDLVRLKAAKDAGFKTYVEEEAYRAAKSKAWERAQHVTDPAQARDGEET